MSQSLGFRVEERDFDGTLFRPASAPRAGALVFHGGGGPTAHDHQVAQRLAELGYAAYVPDLFGETFTDRAHGAAVVTGSLVSSIDGPADPEVESAFRQAFRRQPTWTTGAAVIDLLTALKRQEVYAIDVCETTYNAAKTEGIPFDKVTALFTACVRVMPNGREPDQNYKAVPATYWQELRSLAARQ